MEAEEHLGAAPIPGDDGTLDLFRRGEKFTIRVGETELMSSLVHDSEDDLAALACARLIEVPEPTLLIGGLGMGFTLAAALKGVGPAATVIVAELIPDVVDWNRGPLARLAGRPLDDPRVSVRLEDVGLCIKGAVGRFDGILLDVDNGPKGLTRVSNDRLYSETGLTDAYLALRPGGVLAVWSSAPEKSFAMRLRKIGFDVEEVRVASGGGDLNERHTIWLAINRA